VCNKTVNSVCDSYALFSTLSSKFNWIFVRRPGRPRGARCNSKHIFSRRHFERIFHHLLLAAHIHTSRACDVIASLCCHGKEESGLAVTAANFFAVVIIRTTAKNAKIQQCSAGRPNHVRRQRNALFPHWQFNISFSYFPSTGKIYICHVLLHKRNTLLYARITGPCSRAPFPNF
jgi:hypothetical protein